MPKAFVSKNHDGNTKATSTKIVEGQYNKPANKGSIANIGKPVNVAKSGK